MKYKFLIEQVHEYECVIEADSEQDAIEIFNGDYIIDDFGDPINSRIEWEIV